MGTETYTKIDKLLLLTEEMFRLASEGAWDEVEAHEVQRIATVKSLAPSEHDADSEVSAKLKQVLNRNAEIVALAITEKNQIADELRLSRRLEKADKAYRDIDTE